MKGSHYIFIILSFLTLFTILLIFIQPVGPLNSQLTSYFSTPEGNVHYSQVPEGTNTTGVIIIDNTRIGARDIIDFSLIVTVYADLVLASDHEVISQYWVANFSLLKGETRIIKLTFNASANQYNGAEFREFYIQVSWGSGITISGSWYSKGLKIGSTFEEEASITLQDILIVVVTIGMGITIAILVYSAKRDYHRHLTRKKPPRPPVPLASRYPTESAPSPPSPAVELEPLPTERIELIPCPECGAKIGKTQVVCPSCGVELPKCVICNLVIESDDPTASCPECGARGHRAHFREWVHVKGYCPICKTRIDL